MLINGLNEMKYLYLLDIKIILTRATAQFKYFCNIFHTNFTNIVYFFTIGAH